MLEIRLGADWLLFKIFASYSLVVRVRSDFGRSTSDHYLKIKAAREVLKTFLKCEGSQTAETSLSPLFRSDAIITDAIASFPSIYHIP